MAFDFNVFLSNLNSMGFYSFVLPWLLFLTIFFVIIEKAPIWPTGPVMDTDGKTPKKDKDGKELKGRNANKKIAILIAAILAFFTVNYPLNGIPMATILSDMFGGTAVYVAGLTVVILFFGLGGLNAEEMFGTSKGAKTGLAFVLLLLAILVLAATGFPIIALDASTWTLIFVAVLIGGAMLFLGEDK